MARARKQVFVKEQLSFYMEPSQNARKVQTTCRTRVPEKLQHKARRCK